MQIELCLPFPPSINHYFSYYQGRPVLSKDARTYRHQVRRIAIAKGIKPLMSCVRGPHLQNGCIQSNSQDYTSAIAHRERERWNRGAESLASVENAIR